MTTTTSTIDRHIAPVREAMTELRRTLAVAFCPEDRMPETLESAPTPAKAVTSC